MAKKQLDKLFDWIDYERGGDRAKPGAAQRIKKAEERLGYSLPDDMRKFYKRYDRCVIHPEDNSQLYLLPVEEMKPVKQVIKEGFYHVIDVPDSYVVFAHDREKHHLVIDLAAKRGEPRIIDAFDRLFPLPDWTWFVAKSFTELLKRSLEDEHALYWLTQHVKYGDATTNRIGKKAARLIPNQPRYDVMEFEDLEIHDVYAYVRINKNLETVFTSGLRLKPVRYWHEHLTFDLDFSCPLPLVKAHTKKVTVDVMDLKPRPIMRAAYSNSHRRMDEPVTGGWVSMEGTKRWQFDFAFDVTTTMQRIGKARFVGRGLGEIVRIQVPISILPAGKRTGPGAHELAEKVFGKGELKLAFPDPVWGDTYEMDIIELDKLTAKFAKQGYFPLDHF